jgi:hypothetical protein
MFEEVLNGDPLVMEKLLQWSQVLNDDEMQNQEIKEEEVIRQTPN